MENYWGLKNVKGYILNNHHNFGKGIERALGLVKKEAVDIVGSFKRDKLGKKGMKGKEVEKVDANVFKNVEFMSNGHL